MALLVPSSEARAARSRPSEVMLKRPPHLLCLLSRSLRGSPTRKKRGLRPVLLTTHSRHKTPTTASRDTDLAIVPPTPVSFCAHRPESASFSAAKSPQPVAMAPRTRSKCAPTREVGCIHPRPKHGFHWNTNRRSGSGSQRRRRHLHNMTDPQH